MEIPGEKMSKIKFDLIEKKCKAVAEEFMEELELLPIFLNYYPEVQNKWLEDIGLSQREMAIVKRVVDDYRERKVELENKELPQKRKEVIELENDVLQEMYEARLLSIKAEAPLKVAKNILKEQYPGTAILEPRELEELENLTLFKEHEERFPWNFLVFDDKRKKIIGIKVVKEGKCEV